MLATILAGHTAGASILRGIVASILAGPHHLGTQMRATSSVAYGYYPKSPGLLICPAQNPSGVLPKTQVGIPPNALG